MSRKFAAVQHEPRRTGQVDRALRRSKRLALHRPLNFFRDVHFLGQAWLVSACSRDYRQECPTGWESSGDGCLPDVREYSGPCAGPLKISWMSRAVLASCPNEPCVWEACACESISGAVPNFLFHMVALSLQRRRRCRGKGAGRPHKATMKNITSFVASSQASCSDNGPFQAQDLAMQLVMQVSHTLGFCNSSRTLPPTFLLQFMFILARCGYNAASAWKCRLPFLFLGSFGFRVSWCLHLPGGAGRNGQLKQWTPVSRTDLLF